MTVPILILGIFIWPGTGMSERDAVGLCQQFWNEQIDAFTANQIVDVDSKALGDGPGATDIVDFCAYL